MKSLYIVVLLCAQLSHCFQKYVALFAIVAMMFLNTLTAAGQVTVNVTGSVGANYGLQTDDNGNTTYNLSGDFASLQVEGGVPIEMTISAVPAFPATQTQYWTSPSTWGFAGYLNFAQYLGSYADTIAGVVQLNPVSILDIPSRYNTLADLGPTERSIGIPGFELRSTILPGILDASLTASANLKYDVFLPTAANIVMDQATVVLQSLTIQQGASLVGNGGFTVRTDLINSGALGNVGGTIQGNLYNSGTPQTQAGGGMDITTGLTVQGSLYNTGTISIESGASISVAQPTSNEGTLSLFGGGISVPGTLTNNGTFNWYGGAIPNINNSTTGILSIKSASAIKSLGENVTLTVTVHTFHGPAGNN